MRFQASFSTTPDSRRGYRSAGAEKVLRESNLTENDETYCLGSDTYVAFGDPDNSVCWRACRDKVL
jgi:hypothetical protein